MKIEAEIDPGENGNGAPSQKAAVFHVLKNFLAHHRCSAGLRDPNRET